MDVVEMITEATEAVTEIADAVGSGIAPELYPIYEVLDHMRTLDVVQVCGLALILGALLGLMLWRWFR